MRNKRSVVLLVIIPLLLIISIFVSFNPNGMKKVPIGVIGEYSDYEEFRQAFSGFLVTNYFLDLDTCIGHLKQYNVYTCVVIKRENAIIMEVFYDNTREPIIWEILEKIKSTIDYIQKQKSEEMASDFLTKFENTMHKVRKFKLDLYDTENELGDYITKIDDTTKKLNSAKVELRSSTEAMDRDIADVKETKTDLKREKDESYSTITNNIEQAKYSLNHMSGLTDDNARYFTYIDNSIEQVSYRTNRYNNQADEAFEDIDEKIATYEQASERSKEYQYDLDDGIDDLKETKQDLTSYQQKITKAKNEIAAIESDFSKVENFDAKTLANPVVLYNNPAYTPDVDPNKFINPEEEIETPDQIMKGINLISLQTFFPTILFLIILFLSLLISAFICLNEINSPAYKRIKLIKGLFYQQATSVYLSAFIITIIPILCVLTLGDILFKIKIFENFLLVSLAIILVTSIFIIIGMLLAYLIKNKSTTLLISTFLLVFIMFFSGTLLPIERMSNLSSTIAEYSPGKITVSAFNKVVFYNQGFYAIYDEIIILSIWLITSTLLMLAIKKIKNQ